MKRQQHGMSVKTDSQWPIEDLREKIDILHEGSDYTETGNQAPSIAIDRVGLSSERYHRAMAEKAYELWEKRGRPQGSSTADWIKAEEALKPLWSADLSYESTDSTSDTLQ